MSDVKKKLMEEDVAALEQNAENIPESKKGLLVWVKAHKTQLILVGISIPTRISCCVGPEKQGRNKGAVGSAE